ncbi:hypothetical protein [Parvularcula dongshanensis]|uniref:Uncharacterized protein n=1 Tax=Parvularcula dongshanensis TaxID=1173995 RepID=A0A840I635_9PROT|nr:hypothetical protein [Parvularcula dongshanensis]MBB4660339.1 hypothetical protein [Parvularcula dongshanensis]
MPRTLKPPASPYTALIRARARREQVRLLDELRREREKADYARTVADRRAEHAKKQRIAKIVARAEAGGYGQRPRTPAEDHVRTKIDESWMDKHAW